jgi:hypothetical protein
MYFTTASMTYNKKGTEISVPHEGIGFLVWILILSRSDDGLIERPKLLAYIVVKILLCVMIWNIHKELQLIMSTNVTCSRKSVNTIKYKPITITALATLDQSSTAMTDLSRTRSIPTSLRFSLPYCTCEESILPKKYDKIREVIRNLHSRINIYLAPEQAIGLICDNWRKLLNARHPVCIRFCNSKFHTFFLDHIWNETQIIRHCWFRSKYLAFGVTN